MSEYTTEIQTKTHIYTQQHLRTHTYLCQFLIEARKMFNLCITHL